MKVIDASWRCTDTSGVISRTGINEVEKETHPGFRTRRGHLRDTEQQQQQQQQQWMIELPLFCCRESDSKDLRLFFASCFRIIPLIQRPNQQFSLNLSSTFLQHEMIQWNKLTKLLKKWTTAFSLVRRRAEDCWGEVARWPRNEPCEGQREVKWLHLSPLELQSPGETEHFSSVQLHEGFK